MQDTFLFKAALPPEIKRINISTFFPVLNPSGTLMMLGVRFEEEAVIRHVYMIEKYNGMILIDLENKKCFTHEKLNQ